MNNIPKVFFKFNISQFVSTDAYRLVDCTAEVSMCLSEKGVKIKCNGESLCHLFFLISVKNEICEKSGDFCLR